MDGSISRPSKPGPSRPAENKEKELSLTQLPLEVFDVITWHLSLLDVSQLRLVSKGIKHLVTGSRPWRALQHFRSNYTRCLIAANLQDRHFTALEFSVFELVGASEGSTCVLCRYKMDIITYLLHHTHVPTKRGGTYNHLVKRLRQDIADGSYKPTQPTNCPSTKSRKVVNTCEREWFEAGYETPAASLPLATAMVTEALDGLVFLGRHYE